MNCIDTCLMDETSGEYSTGGSFTLTWPSSGLGEVSLFCTCGNSFSSLMASRICVSDSLNLAVWNAANVSLCEDLNINFCFDSEVSYSVYNFFKWIICFNLVVSYWAIWTIIDSSLKKCDCICSKHSSNFRDYFHSSKCHWRSGETQLAMHIVN